MMLVAVEKPLISMMDNTNIEASCPAMHPSFWSTEYRNASNVKNNILEMKLTVDFGEVKQLN